MELSNDFNPIDEVGRAMHALQTLWQGSKSAEAISVEWLVSQAGIRNSGDTTLINLYQKILNWPLLEKILDSDNVPMTIQGWKDRAVQLDNNYQRKMAILGKTRENRGQTTNNMGWQFFCPNNQQIQNQMRDPNAMDVDALSIKQWEEAMKKGACFGCGEIGHISRNFPKKRQGGYRGWGGNTGQSGQSGASGNSWTKGKNLLAHIRILTAGLPANELEEFMKEAEELGFWNGELSRHQCLLLYLFHLY